jgi:peptidylprolyl isomerase
MRASIACSIVLISAVSFGCKTPRSSLPAWSKTPSGLGVVDLVAGEGPSPSLGQVCVIESMGWIEENGGKGRLFLDTRKRGFPDAFPIGVNRVIKGWDEGIATMKKGGKRLLRVPPGLGYSPQEAGKDIPPDAALIFELELIDIR